MDNPAFDPSVENDPSVNDKSASTPNLHNNNTSNGVKNNGVSLNNGSVSNGTKKGGKEPEGEESHDLKRQVGFVGSMSLVLGTMIGSGIFVTPGTVLKETGSVWLSLIIWGFCGMISTFGAISFIELGTVIPDPGAEYAYLLAAFGSCPAFLFAWASTLILKPASVAIGCLAVAQYTMEPFVDDVDDFPWAMRLMSIVFIFLLTFVNCYSVKMATQVQVVFTFTKLTAFVIVISGGILNLCKGKTQHLKGGFEGSNWDYGSLTSGTFSGLWAFDGWSQLNYITNEMKDPETHIPMAIFLGLPMITIFYIACNISYLTLLTPDEIVNSDSVATLYGERLLGVFSFLMPVCVILSTLGTAHGIEFTAARLSYVAAQKGHLVDFLSYIDLKRNTPSLALIFNSLVAVIMTLTFDLNSFIQFFCFTASIFYGTGVAALIRLRYTMPDAPRPFKVPIVIPYFTVLVSIYLAIAPLIEELKMEYLYSVLSLVLGLVVYFPFVHFKFVLPGMNTVTRCLQLLFMAAPPTKREATDQQQNHQEMGYKKQKVKREDTGQRDKDNSNIQITRL